MTIDVYRDTTIVETLKPDSGSIFTQKLFSEEFVRIVCNTTTKIDVDYEEDYNDAKSR